VSTLRHAADAGARRWGGRCGHDERVPESVDGRKL
jgi:hypothetical protein